MMTPAAFFALSCPLDPGTWHCEDEVGGHENNGSSFPGHGQVEEMCPPPPSLYLVPGGNMLDCLGSTGGLGVHTQDLGGYTDGTGNARDPVPLAHQELAGQVVWMFLMVTCHAAHKTVELQQ